MSRKNRAKCFRASNISKAVKVLMHAKLPSATGKLAGQKFTTELRAEALYPAIMLGPARRRVASYSNYESLPSFLLPAFQAPARSRTFSTTPSCLSKIGSAPLSIPPEVTFNILSPKMMSIGKHGRAQPYRVVEIKGPLGEISMPIPPFITIDRSTPAPVLSIENTEEAKQKAMWGTTRAYLQNHILGVSEGHSAILRMVGVGYRATVEPTATTVEPEYPGQQFVNLKVGYSHPVELGIPKGVTASTPQPTRLLLEGIEREVVMQFAAKIRMWRKPEPYKGKGIFVNGETIKLKNKKIK